MAGASYVTSLEPVTLRWRAAYGKGIRPPPPSARRTLATAQFRQLANPQLAPETQSGIEGGIDISANERLAISLTAFDQRADGLIQHVIPNPRLAPTTIQQQNVGEISNRGGDADVSIDAGVASVEVGVATVASEVRALAKTYSGDLRVGDRVPEVPSWSGHGAVSANVGSLRATADSPTAARGPDTIGYRTTRAGAGCRAAGVDENVLGALSVDDATVCHGVTPAGARIDWFVQWTITNQQRDTRDNLQVTAGRTFQAGWGRSQCRVVFASVCHGRVDEAERLHSVGGGYGGDVVGLHATDTSSLNTIDAVIERTQLARAFGQTEAMGMW
jgi:outer membrane receptor protein involved in Fe transport